MTPDAVEALVTRLYAASGGREALDVDFEVYADALESISDDVGEEAGKCLTRDVDLVEHRPSPGLVRQQAQAIMRRRAMDRAALPESTGEPVTREQAIAWVRHIRKKHGPSQFVDALEHVARRQPSEADERATGVEQGVRPGVGAADQEREAGEGLQPAREGAGGTQ